MRTLLTTILLSVAYLASAQINLELVPLAAGFSSPIGITNAGDERLFVNERSGRVKIIAGDGTTMSTPFLDIDARVAQTGGFSEQGLLGLAFHPDYKTNGYFYVHYTRNGGDGRISRFSVTTDDPNIADPDSEKEILTVGQPFGNHNGGDLKFGPDGYLYIGLGDGGSFNDPGNRSQNPQELLGKMLRIDIDNGDPYAIPADNPFVNDPNVLDEIWSIGLRNPWRYSFDKVTGDLWIGDVGQDAYAEIDLELAGGTGGLNYGWRCYEAFNAYITGGCGNVNEYTDPIFAYSHGPACSITGGFVYRGVTYTDLFGMYIYADYCSGEFWALGPDGSGGWTNEEIEQISGGAWTSFGEDINGEIYVTGLNNGTVYQLTTDQLATPPSIVLAGTTINSMEGDYAPYTAYQWWLEGAPITGATGTTLDSPVEGLYQLEVTTSQGGKMYSNELTVTISNTSIPLETDNIIVFPNPFEDVFSVEASSTSAKPMTLSLYNLEGKLLRVWKHKADNSWSEQFDISDISAGVYNLEYNNGEKTIVTKIVKR